MRHCSSLWKIKWNIYLIIQMCTTTMPYGMVSKYRTCLYVYVCMGGDIYGLKWSGETSLEQLGPTGVSRSGLEEVGFREVCFKREEENEQK